MPGQSRRTSDVQQMESVLESFQQILDRQSTHPGCRKLDGKRNAVETPADGSNGRNVLLSQLGKPNCLGACHEQVHCLVMRDRLQTNILRVLGKRHRRHGKYVFPGQSQGVPAGSEDPKVWGLSQEGVHEHRAAVPEVLTVIEDQEQALVFQVVGDHGYRPADINNLLQTQSGGHCLSQQRLVVQRCQIDEPHAVAELPAHFTRDPQCQPSLAHTADARQCHEPRNREQPLHLGRLLATTDEAGYVSCEVADTSRGCGLRHTA